LYRYCLPTILWELIGARKGGRDFGRKDAQKQKQEVKKGKAQREEGVGKKDQKT